MTYIPSTGSASQAVFPVETGTPLPDLYVSGGTTKQIDGNTHYNEIFVEKGGILTSSLPAPSALNIRCVTLKVYGTISMDGAGLLGGAAVSGTNAQVGNASGVTGNPGQTPGTTTAGGGVGGPINGGTATMSGGGGGGGAAHNVAGTAGSNATGVATNAAGGVTGSAYAEATGGRQGASGGSGGTGAIAFSNPGGPVYPHQGGKGGDGGGVIDIAAETILVGATGIITANGATGSASGGGTSGGYSYSGSGGGGGGGGGTVRGRYTGSYTNSGTVRANGGLGGAATVASGGAAGNGGAGGAGAVGIIDFQLTT